MRAIEVVDSFNWWILSRRKRVDCLQIGVLDGDHDAELFDKVTQALAFIKAHDPLRYKRLLRDLERIWVLLLPGSAGSFHLHTWCCRLDCRSVLSSPVQTIASVIVHEATHARLFRRGFGYQEAVRQRVEAICLRREAAFAARSPWGDALQPEIARSLARDRSTWTDTEFQRRRLRGTVEVFRYLKIHYWFVTVILRLYRRRMRRRRQRQT